MKAGLVVRLRVNPKDCQSILDLLNKVGVPYNNLSFSQCTSLALASLLETARTHKTLPEPDPFQFINRMGNFIGQGHTMQRKRLAAANALGNIGEHFQAPTTEPVRPLHNNPSSFHGDPCIHGVRYGAYCAACGSEHVSDDIPAAAEPMSADRMRDARRLSELASKKDMWENGNRSVSWSSQDEEEYQQLYKIIYPEG